MLFHLETGICTKDSHGPRDPRKSFPLPISGLANTVFTFYPLCYKWNLISRVWQFLTGQWPAQCFLLADWKRAEIPQERARQKGQGPDPASSSFGPLHLRSLWLTPKFPHPQAASIKPQMSCGVLSSVVQPCSEITGNAGFIRVLSTNSSNCCCPLASAESLSVPIAFCEHLILSYFRFFFALFKILLVFSLEQVLPLCPNRLVFGKRLRRASKLGFLTSTPHVSIIYISN